MVMFHSEKFGGKGEGKAVTVRRVAMLQCNSISSQATCEGNDVLGR